MDIKDKIAKILALADNPNENEAKAALLKARELMAKYKLRPEEIQRADETAKKKLIKRTVGVTCTTLTDPWVMQLAIVISENYCCRSYRSKLKGLKTAEVGFIGLEGDFEVCEKIFLYAVDCVNSQLKTLKKKYKDCPGSERRKLLNAYGYGFTNGLENALKKQSSEHQEWGIVLVTPPEVSQAIASMTRSTFRGDYDLRSEERLRIARQGYADGQKFDPSTKLESADMQ